MAQVNDILADLGMQQYLSSFLDAGIDTWQSLSQIREEDFLKLNMRLGDRRKLQRAIARRQSWPDERPLPTPTQLRQEQQTTSRRESVLVSSSSGSGSGSPSSVSLNTTFWSRSTSLPTSPPASQPSGSKTTTYTSSQINSDFRAQILTILRDILVLPDTKHQRNGQVHEHNSSNMHIYSASFINLSISSVPISSGETLVEEICLALSFPTLGSNVVTRDQFKQKIASLERSSQSFEILLGYEVLLEAFLQNLNHILHLFDEFRLRENFQNALVNPKVEEELSSELFLVFALGATYVDILDPSLHLDLYIRGRVLLSALKSWSDDMWMMRILLLIALYHLKMFPSSTPHFLDIAIQLGQQIGLDSSTFPLQDFPEPRRSHWLRVWKSIDFLHNWLQLTSHTSKIVIAETEYMINMMEPPLFYEECLNSRLTQMNMRVLSSLLKEVLRDSARSQPAITSPPLLKVHLRSLSRFYSELPIYFCLQPYIEGSSSRLVDGANERQKASIAMLYLGIKCQLLHPALVSLIRDSQMEVGSSAIIDYANQCVESAKMIVAICEDVSNSGFQLKGHWIVLHFLFNSICIIILNCVRAEKTDEIDAWSENMDYINKGMKLLQGIAERSPVAIRGCYLYAKNGGMIWPRYNFIVKPARNTKFSEKAIPNEYAGGF
ncbi:hypothetical protein BDZ45DRAFT_745954 [Acephala macrosclerotiorum]|nr:hypothetical protein BDZ45DRAFT_745954 [Acephala macrosclerotiorum]